VLDVCASGIGESDLAEDRRRLGVALDSQSLKEWSYGECYFGGSGIPLAGVMPG
jgi:hypothetical protein